MWTVRVEPIYSRRKMKSSLLFLRAAVCRPAALCFAFLMCPYAVSAQGVGSIAGTVRTAGTNEPLPGVQVFVEGTQRGAVTAVDGSFVISSVPAGSRMVEARFVGFETSRHDVRVTANSTTNVSISLTQTLVSMEDVVVTTTGVRQARSEIAATVQSVDRSTIDRLKPSHPSEIMSRIPGVWLNTTSGEGHMTAIRQPLTTDPVYLYLENGVPTRSTGFFNHNALYEVNVPMAEGIEVIKGPGTALYGSDAVGGVINVTTLSPPSRPMATLTAEGGSFGFRRVLLGAGTAIGAHRVRLDFNGTGSDGWRNATEYERHTGTLSWYARLPGASRLKTVASVSVIDQEPAGSSSLSEEDFRQEPTINYAQISFRQVTAVRVSSAYERYFSESSVELTPYFRLNEMDILPNWSLTFDPAIWRTRNTSFGFMARYRHDLGWTRLVAGADLEFSPGQHHEDKIEPAREGAIFNDYEELEPIYDYDVDFRQASPYVHAEFTPVPRLHVSTGLRLDVIDYAYENHLSVVTEGPHRRAASTSRSFAHASPKLGMSYRLGTSSNVFASYRHAFRVPSEGQLFRQGSTNNTLDLKPVRAENLESGLRLRVTPDVDLEVSVYRLWKTDDIITFTDAVGIRITTNAGETSHTGIETALRLRPFQGLEVRGSFSYAVHRFESWRLSSTADLSGNEMDVAPRVLAFASATYVPPFMQNSNIALEWNRIGSYWMDPENTVKYDGNNIVNLVANIGFPFDLTVFGRLANLTNELYAEQATYNALRGEEFAPALPRTLHLGVRYRIGGGDER